MNNITEIITALRDKATWCVLARQKVDKALFTSAADALEAAKRDTDKLLIELESIRFQAQVAINAEKEKI